MTLHNRKHLKETRRKLRNNLTPAEATLWKHLQRKQLEGRKFRRQHSVGNYILDFYLPAEKLSVELDGASHFTPAGEENDSVRDSYLAVVGITVLRFENKLVFEHIDTVLDTICRNFKPEI
ncbi:MAG: endonuclease domain-containing protein [Owenweeksia sp.]